MSRTRRKEKTNRKDAVTQHQDRRHKLKKQQPAESKLTDKEIE